MAYVKGQPFKPQFTDPATNTLMSNGAVEFYLTGTSTPTPYYTDSSGTAGGTSLTLDSGGKPSTDIFFDTAITYKLVVKNAAGGVVETLDPFRVNDTATKPDIFSTVAALRSALTKNVSAVQTLGYYTAGDGGGALYRADTSDSSTSDDGFLCIVSNDGVRFKLQTSDYGIPAKQAGLVWDNSTDDTTALQALVVGAGSTPILCPDGGCKHTDTINLERDTKFIGPSGAGGLFAGFGSFFNYAPTAIKSTIAGSHADSDTTITLSNAAAFPDSGRIYVGSINGEWISYTGKTGNQLTGCTRNVTGGTVSAAQAYSGGETVWLNQPAFQRADNSFSGTFKNVAVYNDNFVDTDTGWDDLGVGLYLPEASYATALERSLIYGFEKGAVLGEAYVTSLIEPMFSRCRYVCQIDVGNAATVYNPDIGSTGDASSVIDGWGFYFKNGNGAAIYGGNVSNGGYNIPIVADDHSCLSVVGGYTEATNNDFIKALNNGSIYVKNFYAKGSLNLGRVETGGTIYIDGIEYQNITNEYVVSTDGTGQWEIKNATDIDNSFALVSDKKGSGAERYEIPHFTEAASTASYPVLRHEVETPHNTATDLFKVQTDAPAAEPDTFVGVTIDYTYSSDYVSGGYTSEKGQLDLIIRHRRTLAPTVTISKAHSAQANLTNTLTLTFNVSSALVTGNRYETTVTVTSSDSASADGDIKLFLLNSSPNRVDDLDYGTITLL